MFTTPIAMFGARQNLALDFTLSGSSIPAGVTSTSSTSDGASILRQTGLNTTATFTPGGPVLEAWRDGVWMMWVATRWENRVATAPDPVVPGPDPLFVTQVHKFSRFGGLPTNLSAQGVGPDGSTLADLIGDNDVTASQGRQVSPIILSGGGFSSSAVWCKPWASGPNGLPTSPGYCSAIPQAANRIHSTQDWRRIANHGENAQPYLLVVAAGGSGVVAPVGDILAINAQADQRGGGVPVYALLPCATGTIGDIPNTVTNATALGQMLSGGVLGVRGKFVMPFAYPNDFFTAPNVRYEIFSTKTITNQVVTFYLEYDGFWSYKLNVDGDVCQKHTVEGLAATDGIVGGTYGSEVAWNLYHNVGTGQMFVDVATNNAYFRRATGTATKTLTALQTAWIGSNQGANFADMGVRLLQGTAGNSTVQAYHEGVVLGDSIVSQYSGGTPQLLKSPAPCFIYNPDEAPAFGVAPSGGRPGIYNMSIQGSTLVTQLAAWLAWSGRFSTSLRWVVIMLGVNDCSDDANTTASILADYNALITQMLADNPALHIYPAKMAPAYGYIDVQTNHVAYKARYDGVQSAIVAGLANTSGVITETYTVLNDQSNTGYLIPALDNGDGLHINQAGKIVLGRDGMRAGLTRYGELP